MDAFANQVKLDLSENALRVLEKRYLRKDINGNVIETPEEMFRRVARNISNAELLYDSSDENRRKWEEEFFNVMANL